MGSLIFLLLVTTLKIRQKEAEFAASERAFRNLEIAEAEKAAELSKPVAAPDLEPPKVIVRSISKPRLPTILPDDDGYEQALAERKRELTELKAKWRSRADQLASDRNQRLRVLALRQQQIQNTIEKTEALQSEILELENNLGEIAGEAAATTDDKEGAERVLVEQQILQMKRRLRAAQVADATAQNDQFQVVPFDPQTGTTRRPIFIECSAAGIRFLPEDILITAKDLEGFTTKANPIAAGTGALINYWTARNLKQRDPRNEPEPYVLMLVRPEGVVAYYVALRMLEPIRTSQGYELIEESTALKLPDIDSGAKTACQTAVNRLMSERDKIARSALMSGSGGGVFGGSSGRRGSGGGPGGGAASGGGVPGGSRGPGGGGPGGGGAGTGGGQVFGGGGGTGFNSAGANDPLQSGGNGGGFTMNDLTGGDDAVGSRSWERVENFQGRPRGKASGDETAGGFGNQAGGPFGNTGGSSGGNGTGPRRGANPGSDTGFGSGPEGAPGGGTSRGSYAAGRGGTGNGPGGETGDGTEDGSNGGNGGGNGGNGGGPSGANGGGYGGRGPGGGPGGANGGGTGGGNSRMAQGSGNRSSGGKSSGNSNGTTFNSSGSSGGGSGQSSDGWYEPEPGMPIGQRPNRKSAKSKTGSEGESDGPGGDSDGDGSYAQGDGSSGSRSGGQPGSSRLSDSGSSSPRFSHNKGSSTRSPHAGERPSKKSSDDDKPLEPEMLAGRRWGFCEPGASIGFEREVRVDVSEDKLVIAEKFTIPVGQGESKQETLELFATALDAYSHEWGRPPQGFFWAPRLKFIVKPEGNGHYEQVNAMMTRAGLATSHEFSKQNETIEFGRDTANSTKPAKKPAPKTAASPKAGANR